MTKAEPKTMSLHHQAALEQIHYLNMIVMSAAAAPDRLPYIAQHPDIESKIFAQHMGSMACILQVHFADLGAAIRGQEQIAGGRFSDFRTLTEQCCARIDRGMARPVDIIHRHVRSLFALDGDIASDQSGERTHQQQPAYAQAIAWLYDVLWMIESGRHLDDILGDAQATDVCTRLCFGEAVESLKDWQRDIQLISAGTATLM